MDIFGVPSDSYWDWLDPGALAMIGAVSFFGGVTRLTMSLTVIMVEMTNDIQVRLQQCSRCGAKQAGLFFSSFCSS